MSDCGVILFYSHYFYVFILFYVYFEFIIGKISGLIPSPCRPSPVDLAPRTPTLLNIQLLGWPPILDNPWVPKLNSSFSPTIGSPTLSIYIPPPSCGPQLPDCFPNSHTICSFNPQLSPPLYILPNCPFYLSSPQLLVLWLLPNCCVLTSASPP